MKQVITFNNKNCALPTPILLHPGPDEIWYTTTDGNIAVPHDPNVLPTMISNTYVNGLGIMKFATNVVNIGYFAFGDRTDSAGANLLTMELPYGVQTLAGHCWYLANQSLTTLIFPNSITSIGGYLTASIPLTTITYRGTMAEWNNISKNNSWRSYTNISTIVCTDGTITY